jgi:hypothetical protein
VCAEERRELSLPAAAGGLKTMGYGRTATHRPGGVLPGGHSSSDRHHKAFELADERFAFTVNPHFLYRYFLWEVLWFANTNRIVRLRDFGLFRHKLRNLSFIQGRNMFVYSGILDYGVNLVKN